jgi:hypothetical protein
MPVEDRVLNTPLIDLQESLLIGLFRLIHVISYMGLLFDCIGGRENGTTWSVVPHFSPGI